MKVKQVYVNNTLVGEAATWAAVYLLLSEKGVGFVGVPNAAEGPDAFFLRGEAAKPEPSNPDPDRAAQARAPRHPDISERAKAIAQGLINTARARSPHLDSGLLRLECLKGGHYWISFSGDQVLRGSSHFEAHELQRKFIDDMERAGH